MTNVTQTSPIAVAETGCRPASRGKETRRNGTIDLLRLYFTIAVVVAHLNSHFYQGTGQIVAFRNGHLSVEFFFIISGYLMALSVSRMNRDTDLPIGKAAFSFLRHKIVGLYPVWFLAQCLVLVLYFSKHAFKIAEVWKTLPGFLMMSQLGFIESHGIPFSWYIPTMLLAMALLFPLCYRFRKTFICWIAPLAALFCAVFVFQRYGKIIVLEQEWLLFAYPRLFRAVCGLCLGCCAWGVSEKLKQWAGRLSKTGTTFLSLLELLCWAVPVISMLNSIPAHMHLPFMLCVMLGTAFSFSGLTWQARFTRGPFFGWIGRVCYAIYLSQFLSLELAPLLVDTAETGRFIAVYILLTAAEGICLYYLGKILSLLCKTIRAGAGRLFLAQPDKTKENNTNDSLA